MCMKKILAIVITAVLILIMVGAAIHLTSPNTQKAAVNTQKTTVSRYSAIPANAIKGTPQNDNFPPVLHSSAWEPPIPMPGPINTAGAEDSPSITADGQNFYFFFTPDLHIPAEKQLSDNVTGIWWTHIVSGNWSEPQSVFLGGNPSLDGCEEVYGNVMWFCSARASNYRPIDIYTAQLVNGNWTDVQNAGSFLNKQYQIGEMALSPDGNTLYYGHTDGGRSVIWEMHKVNGFWVSPQEVSGLDVGVNESLPFVAPDGKELWFTGNSKTYPGPATYCSPWNGSGWAKPVEIVSQFAGEPTLDSQGNLYFVHHFVSANLSLIEADIYVAYRNLSNASAPCS